MITATAVLWGGVSHVSKDVRSNHREMGFRIPDKTEKKSQRPKKTGRGDREFKTKEGRADICSRRQVWDQNNKGPGRRATGRKAMSDPF